ncbi:MAG: HPF/RaiA family ribosome-associated protein [Nitrospirae bacterium]|nr:HPF/RaiA family ribosome-associated protein [Nitrospirota bacterium]
MIYNVFYKNLEPMPLVEEQLEKKVKKVEELLATYDDDVVKLDVTFEKHARREEYYTSLTLALPKKTLRATDTGFDSFNSMNNTFEELLREVKKYKDLLKREHTYKDRRAEKKPRTLKTEEEE